MEQGVAVAPVPSKAGRLDAKHSAGRPRTDGRHQFLETRALHQTRSGAAEVVVDHCDRSKSVRACRIGQRVLPPLALGMLGDLPHGRLSYIDSGAAAKLLRPYL